jgi:Na+-translocating ferredoxin:NAD+ oxidoreductase RNF subunit RnfB
LPSCALSDPGELHERQRAARAVAALDEVVASGSQRCLQRVPDDGEIGEALLDLRQLGLRAGCRPALVRFPCRCRAVSSRSATSSKVKPSRCAALMTRRTVTACSS